MGIMIIRELNSSDKLQLPALQESGNNMSSLQGRPGGVTSCVGTAHRASLSGPTTPELYTLPLALLFPHKICVSLEYLLISKRLWLFRAFQDRWVFSCCLRQAAFSSMKERRTPSAFSPTDSPRCPQLHSSRRVYSGSLGTFTLFLGLFLPGVACSWPSLFLSKSHSYSRPTPYLSSQTILSNLWPQKGRLSLLWRPVLVSAVEDHVLWWLRMGLKCQLSHLPAVTTAGHNFHASVSWLVRWWWKYLPHSLFLFFF